MQPNDHSLDLLGQQAPHHDLDHSRQGRMRPGSDDLGPRVAGHAHAQRHPLHEGSAPLLQLAHHDLADLQPRRGFVAAAATGLDHGAEQLLAVAAPDAAAREPSI